MPRIRRRRRVYRRRPRLKIYRRKAMMRSPKNSSCNRKSEVKVYTSQEIDQSITAYKHTTATATLLANYRFEQDIISGIGLGTGQSQRIGQHICVKKIILDIWGDACPKITNSLGTPLNSNTNMFRVLIDNCRLSGSVANYFRNTVNYDIMGKPDRRSYSVHKDVTRTYTSGYPANWNQGAGGAEIGVGNSFKQTHVFNLNRSVTFDAASGFMKNDRDVYSLNFIGYMPNIANGVAYQSHCIHYRYTIYYTDD